MTPGVAAQASPFSRRKSIACGTTTNPQTQTSELAATNINAAAFLP
jgi:hypothetical protein